MRRFFCVLVSLLICAVWPVAMLFTTIQLTLLQEEFYFSSLYTTNAYQRSIDIIVNQNGLASLLESDEDNPESGNELQTVLVTAISPSWLETQIAVIISSGLQFITQPGTTVANLPGELSIVEIKSALLPVLQNILSFDEPFTETDPTTAVNQNIPNTIPLNYLLASAVNSEPLYTAEGGGRLPDTDYFETSNVQILNDQAAVIQNAVSWLRWCTLGLWIFLALSFGIVIILAHGMRGKVTAAGITLFIAGLGSALSSAGLYFGQGFFSGILFDQLPVPETWRSLVQDILTTLVQQWALYILWPSAAIVVLGIILILSSRFITKSQPA